MSSNTNKTTTTTTSKSNPPTLVLAVGILQRLDAYPELGFDLTSADSVKKADSQVALALESNYDLTVGGVDPGNPDYEAFRSLLRSKPWAGVTIGFGLRVKMELTEAFEKMVNMVVQEVKPTPKLMFSVAPDKIMEAVGRAFGGKDVGRDGLVIELDEEEKN